MDACRCFGLRAILCSRLGSSAPRNPNLAPTHPTPPGICSGWYFWVGIGSVSAPIDITVSISDGNLLGKLIANYLPSQGKLLHRSQMSPINSRGGTQGVRVPAGAKLHPHPASSRGWHGVGMQEKREKDSVRVKTHLSAPRQHGGYWRWLRGLSDHLMDVERGGTAASLP